METRIQVLNLLYFDANCNHGVLLLFKETFVCNCSAPRSSTPKLKRKNARVPVIDFRLVFPLFLFLFFNIVNFTLLIFTNMFEDRTFPSTDYDSCMAPYVYLTM